MGVLSKRELVAEGIRRRRYRQLFLYHPYPKQYEFHLAGRDFRERGMFAGNQEGKTWCASHEISIHATGLYPDWWPGARFDRPVLIWTGSESNETSREVIQSALLGTESINLRSDEMGTGTIPRDLIVKVTKRQAGVSDVADQIIVKHVSGGNSRIALKVYEQGWQKFTGKKIDIFWADEEPEERIYQEGVTRTMAADGGMSMLTFTPLSGMTQVVDSFLSPDEGSTPKSVTYMTIHDCVGGTWPEGIPWAGKTWTGHYTPERIVEIIAAWPTHMRRTKALGVPMMGEGMIFPVDEDSLKVPPIQIPKHWPRVCGIDFGGMGHPFAAAWLAHDRENDIVYLYDAYRSVGPASVPALHAATIKTRGLWIPVAWPHDGLNREKKGEMVVSLYKKQGLNMMINSARYKNDKGGRQDREPGITELYERMLTGRFKVFSQLETFFEEMRTYHRKKNEIVAVKDDLISAVHYAHMELRHAMLEFVPMGQNTRTQRGLRQYG